MAHPFDLNVRLEEDAVYGFDLNLPLNEFGAVDLDWLQNMPERRVDAPVEGNQRRRDCPDHVRQQVYQALLQRSKNGKLGKKDTTIISQQFGVKLQTVQRIWRQGKKQLAQNIPVKVPNLKKYRSGRKPIPIDLEKLSEIPLKKRMTIEDVSRELGISKSRIQRYLRKGLIRRHSSSIIPYLTEDNRKARLKWCIDMIEEGGLDAPKFKDLFDFVFIDEKWFYLHQKSERYYLLPCEDEPHRTCKNKNYIPRIMFLCVVARPRFRDGVCVFDDKIGCFPLVTIEQVVRRSRNRMRGAQVIKPIQSITRDVIRDFMINRVLPAIRAKWPKEDVHKPIFIQQDNAPTHIKVDDPQFLEVAKQDGFDIRLICQPANSSDFNILDLGFFRAIQAIQYKKNAKTLNELIPVVQEAFLEYCPKRANRMFVTLQTVLKEAMKIKGGNKIKIPHMQKQRLEREDMLPLQIPCEPSLLAEAISSLPAN
ncbi:hypothetical protein U9M48_005174 [Paspalum notatum var. saurae]|uniref:DUF7769 domain-containing protein n=1 Tax=Paspalum notatum var. saurae TaxID=547442 RepID=A0AAQ3PWB3_PASNO